MAKYNEVMDHVEISEEMHDRILHNIDDHFSSRRKRTGRVWFTVLGTAAAAAVILLVISPWNSRKPVAPPDEQNPPDVAGIYNPQEYPSAAELSAAVGFEIKDPDTIPFDVKKTTYLSISGQAEIHYSGEEESLIYIKSRGTDDNSGDWNEYPLIREENVDGIPAVLKGDRDLFSLAVWTDGEYSYSLLADPGLKEGIILALIKEIM